MSESAFPYGLHFYLSVRSHFSLSKIPPLSLSSIHILPHLSFLLKEVSFRSAFASRPQSNLSHSPIPLSLPVKWTARDLGLYWQHKVCESVFLCAQFWASFCLPINLLQSPACTLEAIGLGKLFSGTQQVYFI